MCRGRDSFLETILHGGEDAARANPEVVFRARESAIVHISVAAPVQEIVGRQRQPDFAADPPHSRSVEKNKISGISLRKTGEKMLRPDSELQHVVRDYGCEKMLPECMVTVCLSVGSEP